MVLLVGQQPASRLFQLLFERFVNFVANLLNGANVSWVVFAETVEFLGDLLRVAPNPCCIRVRLADDFLAILI